MNYRTIAGVSIAEIEEKKSRFIAYLAQVTSESEALAVLDSVRAEHRMARHNVYAYITKEDAISPVSETSAAPSALTQPPILKTPSIERIRYSDDGEPQKTAGLPVLETLQHAELHDVICIVTRYFGGTLLGTGGLVRAYTQATQKAIEQAEILVISRCIDIMIVVPYARYEQTQRIALDAGAKIIDTSFTDAVTLTIRMLDGTQDSLLHQFTELFHGKEDVYVSDPFDAAF